MTWSVNALAARAVALHVDCPAARRRVLEMLGLVDESGRITPDDRRVYALTDPGTGSDPMLDNLTRRDRSAQAPAGLAVLPSPSKQPRQQQPKRTRTVAEGRPSRAKGKPRPVAKCGTISGASKHYKRREPLCDECRNAYRTYQRELYAARRKANPSPPRPIQCGTIAGYRVHQKRGETTCRQCRDAMNVYLRARYHRLKRAAS